MKLNNFDAIFRSRLVNLTRQYFLEQKFTEIISPVFVDHPAYESTLTAYQVGPYYLATSPEMYLKKLISENQVGNCFSIAHCFRDLEDNTIYHLPEFLMLEWYELGVNDIATQNRTIQLLQYIYSHLNLKLPPVDYLSLSSLDPTLSEPNFNQKFLNEIEPQIPQDKLVFVTDYPTHLSFFAETQKDNPLLCQRFEAYINRIEIANGNTEDTKNPFNIPPCSGCGFGLDRLMLILKNAKML